MPAARHIQAKERDVLVLVGTMKGAFIFRSSPARAKWDRGGPYFPGHAVYAMAYDARAGRHRLWAGTGSMHWGAVLRTSDNFGRTWTNPEQANVKFPEDTGLSLKNIWQIKPGRASEPDVLYAGVEPASLFRSDDAGKTWSLVRGLHDHPHRAKWEPGGGGLCLHTILLDPANRDRMFIAISTGGVYRTDDGGRTWQVQNKGVRAEFLPDKYPEFGQCVHKVVQNPKRPERLFLQNHWGLYRSDDAAGQWKDIANGVPSDFGFAMVAHPHDPEVVYILPLESDEFRCTPEGKLRVYRSRNAGKSWEPLSRGLPQKEAYETVLRDGMEADELNPAGLYFGTRSGKLFGSRDGGASWTQMAEGLPPVVCVKTATVGGPRPLQMPRAKAIRVKVTRPKAARRKTVRKVTRRVTRKSPRATAPTARKRT
ncbi:MAG: WD40/YVTN/BNR-like repeat-containing protein [Candidatus Eiseniibacteriota bacterium]